MSGLIWLCTNAGPVLHSDSDSQETWCSLPRDHEGRHRVWTDDGRVVVEWEDGWHLGPGEWRKDDGDD